MKGISHRFILKHHFPSLISFALLLCLSHLLHCFSFLFLLLCSCVCSFELFFAPFLESCVCSVSIHSERWTVSVGEHVRHFNVNAMQRCTNSIYIYGTHIRTNFLSLEYKANITEVVMKKDSCCHCRHRHCFCCFSISYLAFYSSSSRSSHVNSMHGNRKPSNLKETIFDTTCVCVRVSQNNFSNYHSMYFWLQLDI